MPPPNTILLAGAPNLPQEINASESITPGHLVEFVPSGGSAGLLRKHATANGNGAPWFARESLTPDRFVSQEPKDVPYLVNETVRWMQCRPGDLVLAILPANAAAIVAGDDLASNGDGTLKKNIPGSQGTNITCIVAKAAEAVNNSAGSTTVRIRVYAV